MSAAKFKCRRCGEGANEIQGHLERVNALGSTPAEWECRPVCPEEGVCEHGDHHAPAGKIFCSPECKKCDATPHDATKEECAGLCKYAVQERAGKEVQAFANMNALGEAAEVLKKHGKKKR